ncbi:hypothetical protein [Yinghuangia sp. YIM S10712]|uniref:hypothetical protein n=1 Tax=Yinghuangia sp. YIM S10712 TaxID=3436930 RepID=UPI003F52940D
MEWESTVLAGGPADGLTVRVADRPPVIQVVYPCQVDDSVDVQVQALYVYRRGVGNPLTYAFDAATP